MGSFFILFSVLSVSSAIFYFVIPKVGAHFIFSGLRRRAGEARTSRSRTVDGTWPTQAHSPSSRPSRLLLNPYPFSNAPPIITLLNTSLSFLHCIPFAPDSVARTLRYLLPISSLTTDFQIWCSVGWLRTTCDFLVHERNHLQDRRFPC